MSILSNSNPTLLDLSSRFGKDGKVISNIAELLSQTNEVLQDMVMVECNSGQEHKAIIRTGLPQVFWRAYNKGVPSSKSTTAPITATCAMMEHYFEIDKELVAINDNRAAFLMSEESAVVEAMGQEQVKTLFYGSKKDADKYVGLADTYSSMSSGNGDNILDGGGTASANTSVYLVNWGENSVFGLYPKGSTAGLQRQDLGEETKVDVENGTSLMHQVIRTRHSWKNGLMVKDWRHVVRIANIDTATFAAMSGTQSPATASVDYAHNIVHLMARAIDRIPGMRSGRLAFYANRSVLSLLRRMGMERNIYAIAMEAGLNSFGQRISNISFAGIPVRMVDALRNNETKVS